MNLAHSYSGCGATASVAVWLKNEWTDSNRVEYRLCIADATRVQNELAMQNDNAAPPSTHPPARIILIKTTIHTIH